MISSAGVNRSVLRACLLGRAEPIIGEALFLEYEDLLARPKLMARSPLSAEQRKTVVEAFLSVCDWVDVYFGWRPNLREESDNHLIELAVAGGASYIVTSNVRDLKGGELQFPQFRVVRPNEFMKEGIQ